jgi:hypothetical protein
MGKTSSGMVEKLSKKQVKDQRKLEGGEVH